jgi:hypothetical protein
MGYLNVSECDCDERGYAEPYFVPLRINYTGTLTVGPDVRIPSGPMIERRQAGYICTKCSGRLLRLVK